MTPDAHCIAFVNVLRENEHERNLGDEQLQRKRLVALLSVPPENADLKVQGRTPTHQSPSAANEWQPKKSQEGGSDNREIKTWLTLIHE